MVRKLALAAVLAVLLLSLYGTLAQADIIAPDIPNTFPRIYVTAVEDIDNDIVPPQSLNTYGIYSWCFDPAPVSYSPPVEGGLATADISTSGSYNGSALTASGSGSASSNTAATASSGSTLMFRQSVDCTFHLVGFLSGNIFHAGNWVSGQVSFTGDDPNDNFNPHNVVVFPQYQTVSFNETGTLYAGYDYTFSIGVQEAQSNLWFPSGEGTYAGNWQFDLTVQAVPIPSAILLLGTGLLGIAGLGRFRKR